MAVMPTEADVALRSIRGHAKRLAEVNRARDRAIVAARAAGVPLRTIADAASLSHQTVQNIVDRTTRDPSSST